MNDNTCTVHIYWSAEYTRMTVEGMTFLRIRLKFLKVTITDELVQ